MVSDFSETIFFIQKAMLKSLFKRKPKKSDIEILLEIFYSGRYKETIEKAQLILSKEPNNTDIKRIIGLSNYKIRRFEPAKNIFQKIAEETNIKDDWFNLCTSATRCKNLELADKAFYKFMDQNSIKGENAMLTQANVLYQYMIALKDVEEYQKAHEQLIVLKKYYAGIKHHDDKFLGQYGIPFIFTTLVSGKEILDNVYTKEQINNWLNDFAKQVDDYGKDSIAEFKEKHYPELV